MRHLVGGILTAREHGIGVQDDGPFHRCERPIATAGFGGMTTGEQDPREHELRRISERIDVIANWLIQGRCGDDDECAKAKRLEIAQLRAQRDRLLGQEQ